MTNANLTFCLFTYDGCKTHHLIKNKKKIVNCVLLRYNEGKNIALTHISRCVHR